MNFLKELVKNTFSEWADRTDYCFGLFKFVVIQAACVFAFGWATGVVADEDSVIAMVIVAILAIVLLFLVELYVVIGLTGLTYRRLKDITLPASLNMLTVMLTFVIGTGIAVLFAILADAFGSVVVFKVISVICAIPPLLVVLACIFLPGKWDYRNEVVAE